MFWDIISLQFSRGRRYFKQRFGAKLVTASLFFLVFAAVAAGIYIFFYKGFGFLTRYPYFKDAIVLYSFELFFLLVSFLLSFQPSSLF